MVWDLNEEWKKIDEQRPPKVVLKQNGGTTLVTGRYGISRMSLQLSKMLGLGKCVDFEPGKQYQGIFAASMPATLDFYVCMDCLEADTTVHNSKLMPVIYTSASLGEYVNYVSLYHDVIRWVKVSKKDISKITVAMYNVNGGEIVRCDPYLDRWTLVIMYKRRLPSR